MLKQLSSADFTQALGGKPYVLLIEDEPVAQKVHATMLQKLGCEVDLAVNGSQALALCANRYDLILLDCGLPDIDGFELDKQLRQQEVALGLSERPHILLTAFDYSTFEEDFKTANINDYAIKPVAYNKLQGLMRKWLGNKFLAN